MTSGYVADKVNQSELNISYWLNKKPRQKAINIQIQG